MGWSDQAVSLIILTEQTTGFSGLFGYSPTAGAGNLIFSVAAAAGVDPYGNSYPQGVSSTVGNITSNALTTTAFTITEGPLLFYGSSSGGGTMLAAGASGNFTVPAGITSLTGTLIAGGGGGSVEQSVGYGGGGGECVVVTFTVAGGQNLAYSVGNAGQNTTFNGVTAHAGGTATSTAQGAGGTGSTAAIHYDGGAGGPYGGPFDFAGGGGSSAGPMQPGNAGTPGTGGAAVPGGGAGGDEGFNGSVPGGGGGGYFTEGGPAGSGAGGRLTLSYASEPEPTDLLLAIASMPGSDSAGNSWGTGLTLESSAVPATPAAGCILYYNSGTLYAVGPSGNPVAIATT
jgi:hypothetical protein